MHVPVDSSVFVLGADVSQQKNHPLRYPDAETPSMAEATPAGYSRLLGRRFDGALGGADRLPLCDIRRPCRCSPMTEPISRISLPRAGICSGHPLLSPWLGQRLHGVLSPIAMLTASQSGTRVLHPGLKPYLQGPTLRCVFATS
jgi:hypothetical protein